MSAAKTRTIRGVDHRAVVCKVVGRDPNGRPRKLERLYDEESTRVADGDEFLIGFFKSDCVAKRAS